MKLQHYQDYRREDTQRCEQAIKLFHAEEKINNALQKAQEVLAERFESPRGKGPVAYAEFCLNAQRGQMNENDFDQLYDQRTNEAFLLAQRLLKK